MRSAATWGTLDAARAKKIYAWLRRKPIPYQLRCEGDDGEEKTIQCLLPSGKVKWTDVVDAALGYELVTAVDEQGNVLRELKQDLNDPRGVAQAEIDQQKKDAASDARLPGREPIISVDVPRLVESIAVNMQKASAASAEQQAQAFKAGFGAMTNVITLCIRMLQRVEQRLEEERENRLDAEDEVRELTTTATDAPAEDRTELAIAAAMQALGVKGKPNANGNGKPEGNENVDPVLALKLGALLREHLGGAEPKGPGDS